MSMNNQSIIPPSKGQVQEKLLKFKSGGPSVEEARAAMLAKREAVSTTRNPGGKVPKFLRDSQAAPTMATAAPTPEPVVEDSEPPVSAMSNDKGKRTGGNTPVSAETALISGMRKIKMLGLPPGTVIDLDKLTEANGITEEENEAIKAEYNKNQGPAKLADKPVEEPAVEEEELAPAPVVADRALVEPEEKSSQTADLGAFTVRIYKDVKNKVWVGEIAYKNGAGNEVFKAETKDALMLKLAVGKGHGTIKVREVNARIKMGEKLDTWDHFFKAVQDQHGMTREEFGALPGKSQRVIQDTLQYEEGRKFFDAYPEYYATEDNWLKIAAWLNKHAVPLTVHNMERAYMDLKDADLLDLKPEPTKEVVESAPSEATEAKDLAPASAAVAPTSVAAAPAVPAQPLRKRGTTGLIPGQSSATPSVTQATEDGSGQRGPSEQELRDAKDAATRGDFTALRRFAIKDVQRPRKFGGQYH